MLNTKLEKSWKKKLKEKKIDASLGWEFAEIINVNETGIVFQIKNKKEQGSIQSVDLKWAIKKSIYNSFY